MLRTDLLGRQFRLGAKCYKSVTERSRESFNSQRNCLLARRRRDSFCERGRGVYDPGREAGRTDEPDLRNSSARNRACSLAVILANRAWREERRASKISWKAFQRLIFLRGFLGAGARRRGIEEGKEKHQRELWSDSTLKAGESCTVHNINPILLPLQYTI